MPATAWVKQGVGSAPNGGRGGGVVHRCAPVPGCMHVHVHVYMYGQA